ncbi:repA protein [Photorhabdus sp. APURE]|uniref:repA protein n=1 Tax=Photorhabdus aballayi TaxID=2991723 RepID=UPI00223CDFBF|nr:repA protein [Photorhabdus aballayi]MCW7550125.1 repA protein [Photorhabdus aballayi]
MENYVDTSGDVGVDTSGAGNGETVLLFKDAIPDSAKSSLGKLTVNKATTVQPVSLLRLGVFTPSSRANGADGPELDVSSSLSNLEIARSEGYTDVKITGPQLNYFHDFRCWVAIIHSFSTNPDALKGNKIRLKFTEFGEKCGYPSKRFDSRLRKEIGSSLTRIRSKTITFTKNPGAKKCRVTGLLNNAEFNAETDIIILEADGRLWDLYASDHLTLLRRKPLDALARNETAQAIYTYFEALPEPPAPVTFERLRSRLLMHGRIADQNRKIRIALETLEQIGYLKYRFSKKGSKESSIVIINRNPKLY